MKTKLNIICTLIFLAIFGSVINSFYLGFNDFIDGWNAAQEELDVKWIELRANDNLNFTDSVYDKKAEIWMPVIHKSMLVKTQKKQADNFLDILKNISVLLACPCLIFILISFVGFVRNINRSIIFDWLNVKRLRKLGLSLILYFFLISSYCYLDYLTTKGFVDLESYKIVAEQQFDLLPLITGLVVLLIAEVFAIGLNLKNENELTI